MKTLTRKILNFIKPYWLMALFAVITLVLMVLADLSIPRLIERIVDDGITKNNMDVVLHTALIMIAISIFNAFVAVLNNIFSIRVGEGVARDIREALFIKIQNFSYGDIDEHSTGNLMIRMTSDTAALQRLVQLVLRIGTRAPLTILGSVILMFVTSKSLATAMIPIMILIIIGVIIFSVKMEPMFLIVQQKLDRLNTVLQENIAASRLVKAFVRADFETSRFDSANDDLADNTVRVMQLMSAMLPTLTIFTNIAMVVVIWYGGIQVVDGDLRLGEMIAFTNYLLSTMNPLMLTSMLANAMSNGFASARRVFHVLDTEPEIVISENALTLPAQNTNRVDFRGVDFNYRGEHRIKVLEDINLSAAPGQMVALLGATGSGKTSLINLIPRFYDATSGTVSINGEDVRNLLQQSLLENIAIVPQETILFTGTIRQNIAYGVPDAAEEEIISAAKAAQAHDFIMNFPQGYDSPVEERGGNLSGGQKQRIAIARAIIMKPRILILDDATSAVDVETETHIQNELKRHMKDCISFVVAQRISTVLNADKIIVLDKGRITAQGTHQQLLQTSPIYQEIYQSQLGGGNRYGLTLEVA
jgi:ATP-binding cassette, subfamily B, multidrug efflux pump